MYYQIIEEIKENLTGNKEQDKEYLILQMNKYVNHEYGKEITRELGRLLWDCFSEEEQKEFGEITREETPIKDALDEAREYLELGNIEQALNTLKDIVKNAELMYEDDRINEYHMFSNPLEELIFNEFIRPQKEVRLIPEYSPYLDLYYLYGNLLIESRNVDEGIKYLEKALKLNPVSSEILNRLARLYKFDDIEKCIEYSKEVLKYGYIAKDIAVAYVNIGYKYFYNEPEISAALNTMSLKYDSENITALTDLELVKKSGISPTEEEAKEILKKINIPTEVDNRIIIFLKELIEDSKASQYLNVSLYFSRILYDLTKDENVLRNIREIERIL